MVKCPGIGKRSRTDWWRETGNHEARPDLGIGWHINSPGAKVVHLQRVQAGRRGHPYVAIVVQGAGAGSLAPKHIGDALPICTYMDRAPREDHSLPSLVQEHRCRRLSYLPPKIHIRE